MMDAAPTDARGRTLRLDAPPERIVSLVPSTTETLHDLGLADRIVGITRFCVHPAPWVRSVPKVGGTKDVDPDRVRALAPDLIVGNCEENTREIFEALDPIAPVWAPLPKEVDDALQDLVDLGTLTHRTGSARAIVDRITALRDRARRAAAERPPFTFAWLIWRRPWMASGGDTFTTALLSELGGTNVFASSLDRYPEVTADALRDASPDRVLLSSEPFPFKERHRDELAEATGLSPERFAFVDGELGTWHGSRLAETFRRWPEGLA